MMLQDRLWRGMEWIEDYGAHVGGTVLLDLPEMAAAGPAEVLAIDEWPQINPGPGQLITGAFHHTAAGICNLQVASEREAPGVKGTHPFWSGPADARFRRDSRGSHDGRGGGPGSRSGQRLAQRPCAGGRQESCPFDGDVRSFQISILRKLRRNPVLCDRTARRGQVR